MKQTRYINIIFAIVSALIIFVVVVSYFQADKFLLSNKWVNHTHDVMEGSDNVLASVLDAESVTRGYLITGDKKFVINYDIKIAKIWTDFKTLKTLTKDNTEQAERLIALEPLISDKINTMQNSIDYKKSHASQNLEANSLVYHGQQVSMQIKALLNDIYQAEQLLLQMREADTLKNFKSNVYLTTFMALLSIVFLIVMIVYINKLLSHIIVTNNKLEHQANEISIVNEMNNLLVSSDTISESMQILSSYLKVLLPFCAGVIYLMKSSANYLESIAEWGDPVVHGKIFSPSQCWALRQGKIHEFLNNGMSIACEHTQESNTSPAYICIPLLAQNEIIGVLYLEFTHNANERASDIKKLAKKNRLLIQNLADQASLSISNIKLHDVMKTRSTRDSLTNLYNRSYLTDTLDRDIQRAKKKHVSLAIVMMDLDLFKNVNDTYGHEAGDVLLKSISALLINEIHESDIVCRYGGEEFLIVFYDVTLDDTLARIEKIRILISELKFTFNGAKYSPSASFGIAMYPDHGDEDSEKLIKSADEALYQSKHEGRNKVTVYNNTLNN